MPLYTCVQNHESNVSSESGKSIIESFPEEVSLSSMFEKGKMADRRGESMPRKGCDPCTEQGLHSVEGSRFQKGEPPFLPHRLLF